MISGKVSRCRPLVRRRSNPQIKSMLPGQPPDTADLAIYSQSEIWGQGGDPTWESPDIYTVHSPAGGFGILSQISADIRNLSQHVGAFDVQIHCDTSPFGIGTTRSRLSTQVISIGPASQVRLVFPLTQELLNLNTYLGAHISIEHKYDAKKINNYGSQTVSWLIGERGNTLTDHFLVVNRSGYERLFELKILANGLIVTVTPQIQILQPSSQFEAKLSLTIPDNAIPGQNTVTIFAVENANGEEKLIDGLSYLVNIEA